MLRRFIVTSITSTGAIRTMASNSWKSSGLIPSMIDAAPKEVAKLKYDFGEVETGKEYKPAQVRNEPSVDYKFEKNEYYTLIKNDPDAPSREDPSWGEWHHWLVTNIPENRISEGEVTSAHIGSGPPPETGLHRYVFLVYKQPNGKQEFSGLSKLPFSGDGRPKWKVRDFAMKYNLGEPVAGNYFLAQFDDFVPQLYKQLEAGKKE